MANQEHVERLKAGVEGWNEWRERSPQALEIDLLGAQLQGVDLSWNSADGLNLENVDLTEGDLSRGTLRGASIENCELGGVYFIQTDLRNTSIDLCNCEASDFSGASLDDSKIFGSNFAGSDLFTAELERATIVMTSFEGVKLGGAMLTHASFYDVDFSGADFTDCEMDKTNFVNCNFAGAKGLADCQHLGPSSLDPQTLARSGNLPLPFLRGVGFSDEYIQYIPSLFGKGIEFYSCFISHSHVDKDFARRLYDTLQGRGVRCWLDEHEILPGDKISAKIDEGIRIWDKVLLCCSEMSLAEGSSWWVEGEVERAFKKERQLRKQSGKDALALIPLDLDGFLFNGCEHHFAADIQARNAADFTDWKTDHDKFEAGADKVVAALRSDGGGRRPPPEPKLV